MRRKIVAWIKEEVRKAKAKGIVLGLSGGVDSSLVAVLAKEAVGDNLLTLVLPCYNREEELKDALLLKEKFSLKTKYLDLSGVYDKLLEILPAGDHLSQANLKSRLRMITLYYFANKLNYLVAGTSNKSELMIGYFTKYGDGGADILPLGDLLKTEVKRLAKEVGIPSRIIKKPPSANLWEGQTDEGELGISYERLDKILSGKEDRQTKEARKVRRLREKTAHKRALPKVFKAVLLCLIITTPSSADKPILSGYTELGRKSTTTVFEEEDKGNDFSFKRYQLKVSQQPWEHLSYNLTFYSYVKDYREEEKEDLNNYSREVINNWSYFPDKKKALKEVNLKLTYKVKRYDNDKSREYNQAKTEIRATYEPRLWFLSGLFGLDNYHYLSERDKDQLKIWGKIVAKRRLLKKRLTLDSSFRLQKIDKKKGEDQTRRVTGGGLNYNSSYPYFSNLRVWLEKGKGNTKEEVERDDDYDYNYTRGYIKTKHKLWPKLTASLKYQYQKKDYQEFDYDYRGYYTFSDWKYNLINKGKKRAGLGLKLMYEKMDFSQMSPSTYRKSSLEIKGDYKEKGSWGCSLEILGSKDKYPYEEIKDKNTYKINLSLDKELSSLHLISLDYKFKLKDYEKQSPIRQDKIMISFKHEF